ncbi:bidirectional hydrogenase complex protein HoxU [Desulfomonile tiedjei]|uniref:NADH:ubiquinone oxidoreductase chain G-like protein n=1 Tax=Desulfomonile tiedjei (strain ATCC 49306 / DSM 6799 / DCB-1) TaxID=706587 RepID=I4C0J0_DESTA|nr:bidirectional hydrogenase complex protein HoxU [Desulfomonile tiedjei]AFM23081.1 NADH:ubiquinone oxidoreductase chain G-like protein [Desulfomonile tiedjei DSM 6799]
MTEKPFLPGKTSRTDVNPTRLLMLKIDDKDVTAREDETILSVARQNGINIPTLCHLDGLTERGACRLCIVEVKGSPRLMPSCVTLVRQDMEIVTNSDRVVSYRRKILELLFTERNHVCSVCVSNGHCELQNLSVELGMTHVHFNYLYPRHNIDATHERFSVDHNRCVLCARCIRVCDEVEGAHAWDLTGRGITARVITDLNQPWGESETCTGCGKCIQVCPTGALSEKGKSVAEMIKRRQFLPYLQLMRKEGQK